MATNRIVALLTPAFAALSAWLVGWAEKHLPGAPALDKDQLTALMVVGAGAAVAAALKWLHGWQKDEAHQAELRLETRRAAHKDAEPLDEVIDFHGTRFRLVPVEPGSEP